MGKAPSSPFSEVRLLGVVELGRMDGTVAAVGSGRERTLLAALAVNASTTRRYASRGRGG